MDVYLWSLIVRMVQALFDASPTIVVGWLIAAIFERILGREGTFALFGGRTWRQLPQAWLLGMLLPVCSLGVIPVMVQMRRSGISGGTILAFGLTAPLFNPISVLYGLTLSDPFALMVFCLASLTIVTVMGTAWDWWFPGNFIEPEPLPKTPYGVRRIAAVMLSMCQQAFSASSIYIGIAILGVGLLSICLPAGVLQHAAGPNDLFAPVIMAAVSTFAYVTPMAVIVQVASMFQHGNSIGAAFSLLVLGAGVNLGMIVWTFRCYGVKKSLVWVMGLFAIVLLIGYGVDGPLRPRGVEPADHTHAFDMYCNPFAADATDVAPVANRLIRESMQPEEIVASIVCLVLLSIGAIVRLVDARGRLMERLVRNPKESVALRNDWVLPNWSIATVCLVGLVAASVGGCFLYYPPAAEVRKEMNAVQSELYGACSAKDWETIDYWIPIQEDWAHKLTVGNYLRGKPLTRFQKMRMKVFMTKLELLEHAAEDQHSDEVETLKRECSDAFVRLKDAF